MLWTYMLWFPKREQTIYKFIFVICVSIFSIKIEEDPLFIRWIFVLINQKNNLYLSVSLNMIIYNTRYMYCTVKGGLSW